MRASQASRQPRVFRAVAARVVLPKSRQSASPADSHHSRGPGVLSRGQHLDSRGCELSVGIKDRRALEGDWLRDGHATLYSAGWSGCRVFSFLHPILFFSGAYSHCRFSCPADRRLRRPFDTSLKDWRSHPEAAVVTYPTPTVAPVIGHTCQC